MVEKLVVSSLILAAGTLAWPQSPARELARLLEEKGLITQSDLNRVEQLDAEQSIRLLTSILQEKGVISSTEVARVQRGADGAPVNAPGAAQIHSVATAPPPPQPKQAARAEGPSVTAESKFPVTIYGTLLWNAFYNTVASNISDIPLFASPSAAGPVENFGMTARQTRLGLRYQGPKIGGARLSGQLETDFFGGKAALTNGISMDIVRLRLAFGRLDWTNFSLEAGQDWVIFAPLNPTSLAEYAIPALSNSGNLWIRTPQIRSEWRHDLGQRRLLWQLAALDPDVGDNPVAFATVRQPRAGELGRGPAVESRVAITTPFEDRKGEIGVSGHWNHAKNVGVIGAQTLERNFQAWGVALDYSLPLLKWFGLSGEIFAGRALGIFNGDIGQTYLALGTPGEHGIGTRGGWMQAQFNWFAKWQTNAAYGIEAPELHNLTTGSRSKNQTYMVNLMYKFSPNVTFAWEWRRFLTNYRNQLAANNLGDLANMAVAYTF